MPIKQVSHVYDDIPYVLIATVNPIVCDVYIVHISDVHDGRQIISENIRTFVYRLIYDFNGFIIKRS